MRLLQEDAVGVRLAIQREMRRKQGRYKMRKILVCIAACTLLLVSCGESQANKKAQVVSPTATPTETPVTPTLQPYYMYSSATLLIFIDFADNKDIRASTTQQMNVEGRPCLMTYTDGYMSYTQTGNRITIQALYISNTPFTINADGSLTTNEVDSVGNIIVENFKVSSIQAYNAALAQLRQNTPSC